MLPSQEKSNSSVISNPLGAAAFAASSHANRECPIQRKMMHIFLQRHKMLRTMYRPSILITRYPPLPLYRRLYRFFGTKRLGLPFFRDGGGPGGRLAC
jgi:hypothetical protein